jgi:hypothetical protein
MSLGVAGFGGGAPFAQIRCAPGRDFLSRSATEPRSYEESMRGSALRAAIAESWASRSVFMTGGRCDLRARGETGLIRSIDGIRL